MSTVLGRYLLEKQLGGGRLSAVFAARDPQGRAVALKRLTNPDAALVANFRREVELLRRVSHPNIVPVLDAHVESEPHYYVMPLLEGESLEARVKREGALPLAEVGQIMAQVASALEVLHTLGIVHRDVTPANVMVLKDGRAVLIDFSLAAVIGTRGQAGVGTPLYCAPEQWLGDVPAPSADVYALGGVAYYALSGRAPYEERETAEQTAAQHVRGRVKPLHEVNRAVPRAVSDVVMRALARQPEKRWRTTEEFAQRLLEAAAHSKVARSRKNLLPIAGVATGVAMLALLAGVWVSLLPEPSVLRPTRSVLPLATVTLALPPTNSAPVDLAISLPASPEDLTISTPTPLVRPSVTPLPEATYQLKGDVGDAPEPTPTRTPRATVNLELSAVSGQERWGTPMGSDGCSPPFDDKRAVTRYKVSLEIRNVGTVPLTNWSIRLFNQGVPQRTCLLLGSYDPIAPGEVRRVEVAMFLPGDPMVHAVNPVAQAQLVSGSRVWRICFQGIQGSPC